MKVTQDLLKDQFWFFSLHGSRLSCLCGMVCSMLQVRSVNLSELSICFASHAQVSSVFRRLQRFLAQVCFPFDELSQYVWNRFEGDSCVVLALDRTNWKFGKININFLMLSICYEGMGIPLMWQMLGDKKGVSSQEEQITLIKRFVSAIHTDQIVHLVADREFIGAAFLQWLDDHHIHYVIRLRSNQLIVHSTGKSQRVEAIFRTEHWKSLRKARDLKGTMVYLGGKRISKDNSLILASNLPIRTALFYYQKRWGVELLFGAFKSRGFNFEKTHITKPERINNLIAVMSLAFIWAMIAGIWVIKKGKKIPIKKHGRRLLSIFRVGLDTIRTRFFKNDDMQNLISLLSCT